MGMRRGFYTASLAAVIALAGGLAIQPTPSRAQAAAPSASRQIGTVKAISGNTLTLAADGGAQVSVTVAEGARVLQLAPGSTDLKSAQQITLGDVAVGDRVLVTGKSADDGSFEANRVILMKSSDIAQKNAVDQSDWQRRGSGGLVSAVNGATLTISAGARKIQVETTPATKFRRYASDSVKFEDTKPGTLDQIQTGDQLRVRGDKSEDGLTIKAEEIVSGSFKNLSGTIATLNAAGGSLTLKDLTTKKMMTVNITSNSDLRKLPPEMAARLAARARGAAGAQGANGPNGARPAGAAPAGGDSSTPHGANGPGGGGHAGGGDLSQMLARLPNETLADLKSGEAVMIVATESAPGSDKVTAVTMLSGVEPILAAAPAGSPGMTLSPWNVGGGGGAGAEGAGGGAGPQ
jgi:co-chaperonin GroES (HSP10)